MKPKTPKPSAKRRFVVKVVGVGMFVVGAALLAVFLVLHVPLVFILAAAVCGVLGLALAWEPNLLVAALEAISWLP